VQDVLLMSLLVLAKDMNRQINKRVCVYKSRDRLVYAREST
jgi:hypothetical protein